MDDFVVGILVALFIIFIVFLILLELMCWYWKVNRIVVLLEGIQASLQHGKRSSTGGQNATPSVVATPLGKEVCPFCKELSNRSESTCDICGKMKR
jgi:hypothetical protein